MSREVTNRDWIGKAVAGLVCGYLLALGCSGLFKFAVGAGKGLYGPPGMVSVQVFAIVWTPIVSFCFLFSSTRSAWGWLGLATGLLWGLLFVLGETA